MHSTSLNDSQSLTKLTVIYSIAKKWKPTHQHMVPSGFMESILKLRNPKHWDSQRWRLMYLACVSHICTLCTCILTESLYMKYFNYTYHTRSFPFCNEKYKIILIIALTQNSVSVMTVHKSNWVISISIIYCISKPVILLSNECCGWLVQTAASNLRGWGLILGPEASYYDWQFTIFTSYKQMLIQCLKLRYYSFILQPFQFIFNPTIWC